MALAMQAGLVLGRPRANGGDERADVFEIFIRGHIARGDGPELPRLPEGRAERAANTRPVLKTKKRGTLEGGCSSNAAAGRQGRRLVVVPAGFVVEPEDAG